MGRELDAATLAAIDSQYLTVFHLFTFEFSTTFRLTDWAHDISYNFGAGVETFTSSPSLSSFDSSAEDTTINNNSINIELSGVDQTNIAIALTENFNNKRVVIRRGLFDNTGETATANIIGKPFIIWDGRINSYSIVEDILSGNSNVTWNVASHWADWEKSAGRRCNNEDAQRYFPTEMGFEFTYSQIGDKQWGKVKT